jgi:hypothetical protein
MGISGPLSRVFAPLADPSSAKFQPSLARCRCSSSSPLSSHRRKPALAVFAVQVFGHRLANKHSRAGRSHLASRAFPLCRGYRGSAIVLKVTPSMRTPDIQPDRLTRSVQKIHDLLNLRPGAKTSLIAYSGAAHVVMPVTKDENIVNTFAGALDPKIMPSEGDSAAEALRLADQTLADSGSGSIVFGLPTILLRKKVPRLRGGENPPALRFTCSCRYRKVRKWMRRGKSQRWLARVR